MRLLLATVLATAAVAPAVTTGPAESVGQTTATLTGVVDPNGAETIYHFEYGTTTGYGLKTVDQSAGGGDLPVAVKVPVDKLTPSTTYHFRLVAGGVNGSDATFKTAAAPVNPTAPGISRLSAVDRTPTSARLTARVNPHAAATTWHMEYGSSPGLGRRTPDQMLPAGTRDAAVSAAVGGFSANQRVYWRVVATNAAGVKRSATASFATPRAPTSIALTAAPGATGWGSAVTLRAQVGGSGVNGIAVVLEQAEFPFAGGFAEVALGHAGRGGVVTFAPRPVFLATRFRAVTRGAPTVRSGETSVLVGPRVGIRRSHKTRRAVRVSGTVNPGLPAGVATLQRRSRSGGWALVRRKALRVLDANRSTYAFKVGRRPRAAAYRVVIAPRDAGAHVPARSRTVVIGKRR